MDESGLLNLETVEAVFETKVESDAEEVGNIVGDAISKFGESISKLFGGKDDETDLEKVVSIDKTIENCFKPFFCLQSNDTDSSAPKETSDNQTDAKNTTTDEKIAQNQTQTQTNGTEGQNQTETKKELKIKTIKEPIDTSVVILDLPPMSDDLLKGSKDKLQELDDK